MKRVDHLRGRRGLLRRAAVGGALVTGWEEGKRSGGAVGGETAAFKVVNACGATVNLNVTHWASVMRVGTSLVSAAGLTVAAILLAVRS